MMNKKNVGMVGIGMMGHGIASNLLKHGHALAVLEHEGNQPLDALKAAGAQTFTSAAALAARSEVVILVLTGSPQVEAVLTGADGVLAGLKPGSVVIDCSTAIPSSTIRMAEAVSKAGSAMLDAPMTRTPKEAAEGRLNLLVGGDAALFDACRPLLACFAENITHVGAVGSGHSMKLLHNYVSLGSVALIAEAAACAQRNGVALAYPDVQALRAWRPRSSSTCWPRGVAAASRSNASSLTCWRRTPPACASRSPTPARTWVITRPWPATHRPTWRLPPPCCPRCRTRRPRPRRPPCCRNWSACSGLQPRAERRTDHP